MGKRGRFQYGTVTVTKTFESCIPVTHMFLGWGGFLRRRWNGCRNCLKRLVARMSPCLRLAPTVPARRRVARKYDLLLLRGNVRFVLIMCVEEASNTIKCVFWTARSEYRFNPKPRTYVTSINVVLRSLCQWKITPSSRYTLLLIFRRSPIVIVSQPDGGGLKLYSIILSCVMWHDTPLSAI